MKKLAFIGVLALAASLGGCELVRQVKEMPADLMDGVKDAFRWIVDLVINFLLSFIGVKFGA